MHQAIRGSIDSWRSSVQIGVTARVIEDSSRFFHVLILRKYISDPPHVLQPQPIELDKDLTCEECPIAIVN